MPAPSSAGPQPLALGVLRQLGFFGFDSIELSICASLLCGDPVLLVGDHGSAKTMLASAIAHALGLRFHAYDASKSLFEDVIGFPDPTSLAEGRVRYVPTPLSIWDKNSILIDELNRANPGLQNKWLEVVRSRRIMGEAIPGLQYVFAAMNPRNYLGVYPLDEAMLGRFAWVLPVPGAAEMGVDDLRAIAANLGADDAPLARDRLAAPADRASDADLAGLVARGRDLLQDIARRDGEAATRYAAAIALQLRPSRVNLDGRRIGMIRRNVLAALALARASVGSDDLDRGSERHERVVERTVWHSLPFAAQEEPFEHATFEAAHLLAYREAFGGEAGSFASAGRSLDERDPARLVAEYERSRHGLDETAHHEVLARVLEALDASDGEGRGRALHALVRLVRALARGAADGPAPPDVVGRALAALYEAAGCGGLDVETVGGILENAGALALDSARSSLLVGSSVRSVQRKRPNRFETPDMRALRAADEFRSMRSGFDSAADELKRAQASRSFPEESPAP